MFANQFFASNYFAPNWWAGVASQTGSGGKLLLALHGTGGARTAEQAQGRSGYWRLFYTQMQEKANEKRKARNQPVEQIEKEIVSVKKTKSKQKRVASIKVEQPTVTERTPSLPKYAQPAEDLRPQYLQEMWQITLELRRYVIETPTIQQTCAIILQPECEDELLLLLAA